jgi:sphingolipid 4-desaturase/C4-monooxygenase
MPQLRFETVEGREPHALRRKEMIKAHPSVRKLFGTNPWTLAITLALVAGQLGVAFGVANQPWWVILLAAWCIGAFIDQAFFVIIHECAHNLVFKRAVYSKLVGILANIPMIFPSSIGFRNYHLLHHQYQGEYDWDADLAGPVEARLVSNIWWRKALWLLFFPIIEGIIRPARVNKVALFEGWALFNAVVTLGTAGAVILLWGWGAFAYLALSLFASIGLHPIGARWIQEHYVVKADQETYSYYGPNNLLALNVGFHNEHHDFMMIPWNHLPKLRKLAPEYYDDLAFHTSYTRLLKRFLFDEDLSLYSRYLRESRGAQRRRNVDSEDTEAIIASQTAQALQDPDVVPLSV